MEQYVVYAIFCLPGFIVINDLFLLNICSQQEHTYTSKYDIKTCFFWHTLINAKNASGGAAMIWSHNCTEMHERLTALRGGSLTQPVCPAFNQSRQS